MVAKLLALLALLSCARHHDAQTLSDGAQMATQPHSHAGSASEPPHRARCPGDTPQGDMEWLRWIVVDLNVQGIGIYNDSVRTRLLADFEPDYVDWAGGTIFNRGDFARSRGVPTSGPQEFEWATSLQWTLGQAEEMFMNNGVDVSEDGSVDCGNKVTIVDAHTHTHTRTHTLSVSLAHAHTRALCVCARA